LIGRLGSRGVKKTDASIDKMGQGYPTNIPNSLTHCGPWLGRGPLTVVFSAHDELHNDGVALRDFLSWGKTKRKAETAHRLSVSRRTKLMTDSVKIERRPHDPIASNSECGGRPDRHERVAAAPGGNRSLSASDGIGSTSCGHYRSEPRRWFS
jgi:hypothetical protein